MRMEAIQAMAPVNPSGMNSEAVQGGDGFAQLLMALFGNGMTPDGAAILNGLLPEEGGLMQDDGDEEENIDGMQMLASLMNNPFVSGQPQMLPEAVQNELDPVTAVQILAQKNPALAELLLQTPVKADGTISKGDFLEAAKELLQPAGTAESGENPVMQVVSRAAEGQESETNWLDGQMKFRQAIAEVKKTVKDEPKPETQAVDVEALQQKVNANRTETLSSLRAQAQEIQTREGMVNQVKSHILQNLSEGKDEFIVQLKPESLGEITIKMTAGEDGKISLSILTASTQTAKLLNESVEALKNSLRPLQAEVREITTQRPEETASAGQGGLFGSGFEGYQNPHYTPQDQLPKYYYDHGNADEGAQEESAPETQAAPAAGLNTYI